MIKRPLLWVLGAYFAGMFFAWYRLPLQNSILLVLIAYLLIYLLMFRVKKAKNFINRRDSFLWCLPMLLLFGIYTMGGQLKRPALDLAFEAKAPCELTGEISMIVEKQSGKALYVKNNTVLLSSNKSYLCEKVIVYTTDQQNYLIGNHITIHGEIQKFSEALNPGQFNEKLYYQIENIDYKVKAKEIRITDRRYSYFPTLLYHLKLRLIRVYDTLLSEKESGALIAMLLGEKYLLDEELKNLYQENGISHILAISGLHISLIGMFVYKILRKLKVALIPATIFAILFIYSYGILTNFSVSTNRSVVMMMILLLSTIFGKTYDMLSATALSAFIILLHNPLQIFSAGFLLSFGAVLGIAVLIPCLKELFPAKPAIVNSIYLSISAQIITMPMVLTFFFQFPVYSLLINLLILPCTSALVLSAIFAGIAGIICLPLGVFCIGGTNYILKFHEWVCRIGSDLPGNLITPGKPDALQLFLYTAFLLAFLWGVKRYKRRFLILLPLMSVIVLLLPGDNPGLEITMIDVGQGDAIFLESAAGTTYLIDGGSSDVSQVGTYRIQPFLLSQGVDHIDYAFVTHGDTDHISGLRELLVGNKIMIRRLVLPDTDYEDEALEELKSLAGERGVEIIMMKRGDHLKEGDLLMTCLHPSPEYPATSKNAYSLVLSVTYGEFDMLFTGDLEKEGEELVTQLLQEQIIMYMNSDHSNVSGGKLANELLQTATDYDVLKVAHHGSKNSTFAEFLHIIKPEYALISCGKDNSYGHPNVELLERLSQVESKVMITYENGAICIKTDGERMEIEGYGK